MENLLIKQPLNTHCHLDRIISVKASQHQSFSETLSILGRHKRQLLQNPTARSIDLGLGVSSYDPLQRRDLQINNWSDLRHYGSPFGRPDLLHKAAQYHQRVYGVPVDPESLCITAGATQGLILSLCCILEPGDEVILPEIGYPAYRTIVESLGAVCVFAKVKRNGNYLIPALGSKIGRRTKAIFVNSPSNPLGGVLTRDELSALADFGTVLISDEAYGPLTHKNPPVSLLLESDQHFAANSFSKSLSFPGARLGYLIFPRKLREIMQDRLMSLTIATSQISQHVLGVLLEDSDNILREHKEFLADRRGFALQLCQQYGLRLFNTEIEGGFFLNVDISSSKETSTAVCNKLLTRRNLVICPGSDFAHGKDPQFVRINFASHEEDLRMGLGFLAEYLRNCSENC
jgi:aspartate/methionine/tyrosine aminotransferase